jgi:hypothetical protein
VKVDPGIADVILISVYIIPGRTSRWFGCENKVRDPRTKAGDGIRLANLFDLSSAPKNSIPYRDKTSFATVSSYCYFHNTAEEDASKLCLVEQVLRCKMSRL